MLNPMPILCHFTYFMGEIYFFITHKISQFQFKLKAMKSIRKNIKGHKEGNDKPFYCVSLLIRLISWIVFENGNVSLSLFTTTKNVD
jgi:hypothetical protein